VGFGFLKERGNVIARWLKRERQGVLSQSSLVNIQQREIRPDKPLPTVPFPVQGKKSKFFSWENPFSVLTQANNRRKHFTEIRG
jgi:hypothetical protein